MVQVGQQVHFYRHNGEAPPSGPLAATVACVNEDGTVNLGVLNELGQPFSALGVTDDHEQGDYYAEASEASDA